MKIKVLSVTLAVMMAFAVTTPPAYAVGARQASASFLLPSTGQAMNGQIHSTKTKIMVGLEIGLITTIAILGGVVGGGVVWAGIGPLIANHLWSATDAYKNAQNPQDPAMYQQQMMQSQQTLDLSRQQRFEREQIQRSAVRDRIISAGEAAY